jgi:hypothetical protein
MVTVTPTNLQKIEFDVTTAEGPSRITIVSGILPALGAGAFSGSISSVNYNLSVSALVDPTLTPGQFRRATATAALAGTSADVNAAPSNLRCSIDNVEASLHDQSGRIEIRVDAQLAVSNGNMNAPNFTFQVTTLAKL